MKVPDILLPKRTKLPLLKLGHVLLFEEKRFEWQPVEMCCCLITLSEALSFQFCNSKYLCVPEQGKYLLLVY